MNESNKCPKCGQPVPPDAPEGLCPRCVGALNLDSETGAPGAGAAAAAPPPSAADLAPHFPQLEILELLGRGGMGVVYKVRQKELDRIAALKILPPGIGSDPAFAERFAREAKALARLNHPGIVTIYDSGRTDGLYYFLMEFVDGVSLGRLMRGARVSPREALAIVPQICDALQYAHDQGIVHRDIKPENILLDRQGRVKVADFGLAKLMGGTQQPLTPSDGERVAGRPGEGKTPALTDAGKVMGTPAYMAPEQAEHPAEVDHRADIYALGVVFYQMLTGELPDKKLEPPSRKVQIDVRLDEVVLHALEKEPGRRYTQASVMKTELETIAADQPAAEAAIPSATDSPAVSLARLEHETALLSSALRMVRWPVRMLGTLWGAGFLLFVLRDGLPLVAYAPPRVAVGIQATFLALLLAGLAAGWWRDGLAASLTLAGWTLFFFSERQPFPHLVLYAPAIIGLMYLWLWLLKPAATAQVAQAQTGLANAAANPVTRLIAQPAKRLMWLGILGLAATLLIQCRGYGETTVIFGSPFGATVWSVPVPAGCGGIAVSATSLLPALCLLVVIGAWNMRRLQAYPLALASATVATFVPPLFPAGLPLGLWAWFLLTRPQLRLEFSRAERTRLATLQRSTPRFSRLALAGALVGILPVLLTASVVAMTADWTTLFHPPSPKWHLIFGVLFTMLGTGSWSSQLAAIALAWAAWEGIRRSQGRLRGAGLIAFAVLLPFLGKLLWWLRGDSLEGANWLLATLARSQVVLLACAGIALWLHRIESNRSRSPQQHSSWWFFAPSIRWLIVGMALFCLLRFSPRIASTDAEAKPAVTINASSQAGPPANSAPPSSVRR